MKTANYFKNVSLTALLAMGSFVYAQDTADADNSTKIKEMADKACDCAEKISVNLTREETVEEINSCITAQITSNQLMSSLKGLIEEAAKEIETDSTAVVTDTITDEQIKNINISINSEENFEEIQAYMFANCPAVKTLMASNNIESKHSMSKNKKALEFYYEGLDYYEKGKYDMAIVSYNKAVKKDPKFAFAWDNLGLSYRQMGNYKEAVKCYKKSLEIDPTGVTPLQNMAVAYTFMEDFKQAGETYEKYIKLYPNDPEGYYGAGRAYYMGGNHEQGVDNMFKAFKIYSETKSPYISDAQQMLAFFYQDLEQKGKLDIFMQAAKNNNINIQDEEE